MNRIIFALVVITLVGWMSLVTLAQIEEKGSQQAPVSVEPVPEIDFAKDIQPFLSTYCYACHGKTKMEADLSLERYDSNESVYGDRAQWDIIVNMLETRQMPPPEVEKQPTEDDRGAILARIRNVVTNFDCSKHTGVGRVTIRRLNRTEYNNTIRDLVGIEMDASANFPADDVGYGFDNIGDVLSVSPLLIERYLDAAEQVLDRAILIADPPSAKKQTFTNINRTTSQAQNVVGKYFAFDAGEYRLRLQVAATARGSQPVRIALLVGDVSVREFSLPSSPQSPQWIEATVRMQSETTIVRLKLLDVNHDEPKPPSAQPMILTWLAAEIDGPYSSPSPTVSDFQQRLMAHQPDLKPRNAAREIVHRFASRAFRRPAKENEVDQCMTFYDMLDQRGERFELCVRAALFRVLVSPSFLFRVESDPQSAEPGETYAISEYELASRLSYFLWNSMPDDQLLTLAANNRLRADLDTQVRRMIQDPKSNSFLQSFAEQWLLLRKLELAEPDPETFPEFDDHLRRSMLQESTLFFQAIAREDRSILELLDANFTFVNDRLARHYGIPGIESLKFVRTEVPDGRGGILTQGSVLTLTSNATRTSPVKRGKFVLEQIFNTPPPPPPANVPELESQKQLTGTLRQVMEQHRENALCASCHQRMDPLGFAFENFDATGRWRTTDKGAPIDASGQLPNGRSFEGAIGLKMVFREKKELFAACLVEKMLTYAMGRGVEAFDRCALDSILVGLAKEDFKFSSLIIEIVHSDPFQRRTAAGATQ